MKYNVGLSCLLSISVTAMRFIKLLHGFMSLFPCPSQHSLRSSNLTIGLVLEELPWKSCFVSSHFKVIRFDSKVQGVDWRSCHVWTRPCSYWSKEHISQQLLFTKQEYWYKKFVQTCQSSSRHSLDLEARVLNLKGVYLAHRLVFLSDSKGILLFKGLSTNHF